MKRLSTFLILFIATICAHGQNWPHFITDADYRAKVNKAFQERQQLVGEKYMADILLLSNPYEIEALRFLYAYMPIADITDYPFSFHLQNVRKSFQAQEEMPWGKLVPELLFRHFVLPVRVNNEALDDSRSIFYDQLKARVKGLSMKEAILEVNHWCHERVTYAPSDGRTLSPLACIKKALGRCGEESTLTVAALRAIGIPARQVYTPRWAHTDDNHAWVEAWAEGQWYFLGACEPEPVLNLGWFNLPASRALLMHTRAFGHYDGPEEVMLQTSNFTEINLIDNYTKTDKVNIQILDHNGNKVPDARVDFKIYNYAELCTVVTKYADHDGQTTLTAGLGDMVVWACKAGRFGYKKVTFGKDHEVIIRLEHAYPKQDTPVILKTEDFNLTPPPESAVLPHVTAEQVALNKQRLAQEDSIRKAYEATFLSLDKADSISPRFAQMLVKSRGNHHTIVNFIRNYPDQEDRIYELLCSLSDKDLCDITEQILEDNLLASSDECCPRVENEMITRPFKRIFEQAFDDKMAEQFRRQPNLLVKWVNDNIRINPDKNALRIAQTPLGVWESRITDPRSRDIFFVTMARSLGIKARKDVVTSKVQYAMTTGKGQPNEPEWIEVSFNPTQKPATEKGKLQLTYSPIPYLDDPKYYTHFTISKIENGITQLMNFDEMLPDGAEATSWSNTFRRGITLDAGLYLLTTGIRLADGSVLGTNQFFTISHNKTTTVPLRMRESNDELSVIGAFDSESKVYCDGKEVSILSQVGRGYYALGIIGVGQEPSNHALQDIAKVKERMEQWGRLLLLLFESVQDFAKFNTSDYGQLPTTVQYAVDPDGRIKAQICKEMRMKNEQQLPIFIVADTFNRIVFSTQGYTIGLGDQLIGVVNKL